MSSLWISKHWTICRQSTCSTTTSCRLHLNTCRQVSNVPLNECFRVSVYIYCSTVRCFFLPSFFVLITVVRVNLQSFGYCQSEIFLGSIVVLTLHDVWAILPYVMLMTHIPEIGASNLMQVWFCLHHCKISWMLSIIVIVRAGVKSTNVACPHNGTYDLCIFAVFLKTGFVDIVPLYSKPLILFINWWHFQWPWMTPNLDLKGTPLFDMQYLRSSTK